MRNTNSHSGLGASLLRVLAIALLLLGAVALVPRVWARATRVAGLTIRLPVAVLHPSEWKSVFDSSHEPPLLNVLQAFEFYFFPGIVVLYLVQLIRALPVLPRVRPHPTEPSSQPGAPTINYSQQHSGRNIVLCCDGTSNEFTRNKTNVVKLYSMLIRDDSQLCYYDPGVGTFSSEAALTPAAKRITKWLGLALGLGLGKNIKEGYTYLMNHWKPGDRIYIFGFSRGAYTARGIAGMLWKCGLLEPGNDNLVSYTYKMYKDQQDRDVHRQAKETFGRKCPVHFLGLWDTVTSVGWVWDPLRLPHTTNNPSVKYVRHAIALDERRAFFRQNQWGAGYKGQDIKQVWFAGVHSDVGGSYPDNESGLSQIALEWMVDEAIARELRVNPMKRASILPKAGQTSSHANAPDHTAKLHNSMKVYWWPAEFFPKLVRFQLSTMWIPIPLPNLFRRRFVPEGAVLHESVIMRKNAGCGYAIPPGHPTEPWLGRP